MREIKIEAATILDMADMAASLGASRAQWGLIRETFQPGQSWTLRHVGELVGIAGFMTIGEGQAEAWFNFQPGASACMVGIVRAIRLTMDRAPYRAIVTLCTSEAGTRIARAAGFHFAERTEFGEVWAYGKHRGDADRGGGCTPAAAAADAGAAAHEPGTTGAAAGGA